MSRVWGWTAFAQRSAAMKAPVGLLSGSAVYDSRWRGVALTSAAPTRSLRKCRRIAEVKSRRDRTFSRIENLWPRDGSCPLPLRSKSFPGNCFRIVKTPKISKRSLLMYGSHRLLRTKFLPLFCSGVDWKAGITFGRLMKDSRFSFPEKKNTAHAAQRWILSGESAAKLIGCVAGRCVLSGQSSAESGGYHGENHHFFSRDLE